MLRTIANIGVETTLKSELDLLTHYLAIQSSRYEGRLEYCIQVDDSLLNYKVPALIFQPIVENAVIHACETIKEKTFIKIYNTYANNTIVFSIEDNGKGIDDKTLSILHEKLQSQEKSDVNQSEFTEKKDGNGIGILNVHKRIKIRYGEKYGIEIASTVGKGTCVRIILPKNIFEGNDNSV